jgi:formylglycine-generating enzyme required for sulfatase activity
LVVGGSFYRSYDGVSAAYMTQAYPATVSDFRLDKFEVTVGRFRKFKAAWDAVWRPRPAGIGKHTHLNGGNGLTDSSGTTTYEAGWPIGFDPNVAPTDTNLFCDPTYGTWTTSPGANETRPMNCLNWYEAYAFCIWDGGFLPSEAEWNYAAAGGSEQRAYPWSNPATSTTIDCTYANYYGKAGGGFCSTTYTNDVGAESSKGDGRWGGADLAGNVNEWNLDRSRPDYLTNCIDCSYLPSVSANRVIRGGGFDNPASYQLASFRNSFVPDNRNRAVGARCARSP